ncbi:hypothetical protein, partial [Streptomyces composti]|uniref:hypothetical protein n=1 Tax=Streptomyces composti TaxID=2720025 RepID=UPI0019D168FB
RSDFLGAFPGSACAFPFPAHPTLSEVLGRSDRPRSDASGEASSKSRFQEAEQMLTVAGRVRTHVQATV